MGPPEEYADLLVPADTGLGVQASPASPGSSPDACVPSDVPWQIWAVVGLLALEGVGNLLSILQDPRNAIWFAAKCLFVVGLLRRWRFVFVLVLLLGSVHVLAFAVQAPLIALLNLAVVVLVASTRRFYFPKTRAGTATGQPAGPSI